MLNKKLLIISMIFMLSSVTSYAGKDEAEQDYPGILSKLNRYSQFIKLTDLNINSPCILASAVLLALYVARKLVLSQIEPDISDIKMSQRSQYKEVVQQSGFIKELQEQSKKLSEKVIAQGKVFKTYVTLWAKHRDETNQQLHTVITSQEKQKQDTEKQFVDLADKHVLLQQTLSELQTNMGSINNQLIENDKKTHHILTILEKVERKFLAEDIEATPKATETVVVPAPSSSIFSTPSKWLTLK